LSAARKQANSILGKLGYGTSPSMVDSDLLKNVRQHEIKTRLNFSDKYDKLFKEANALGIKGTRTKTAKVAKDFLKEFSTKIKKNLIDTETRRQLNLALDPSSDTFANLLEAKQTYNDYWKDSKVGGKKNVTRVYNDLKHAIKQDLNDGIISSGNNDLKDRLDKLEADYNLHVGPLNNPLLQKILAFGEKTGSLHTHLLKGKGLQILKDLSKNTQHKVAYRKFIKSFEAEGLKENFTNPFRLIRYYDKGLDEPQKEALFKNNGMRDEFNKLRVLTEVSREPVLKERRKWTGARVVSKLPLILSSMLGGSAVATGSVAPLAPVLGGILGARGLSKALTSKWLRDAYIKKEAPELTSKYAKYLTVPSSVGVSQYIKKRNKNVS